MNMAKSRNSRLASLPPVEQQRDLVRQSIELPLELGQEWYIIDTHWLQRWKEFVGYTSAESDAVGEDSSYPGPIDNSGLLSDVNKGILKEELEENVDYNLVYSEAWKYLQQWYHLVPGQKPIERRVIEQGMFNKALQVEIYPMELSIEFLEVQDNETKTRVEKKSCSKSATLGELEMDIKQLFGISNDKELRLWTQFGNMYEELTKKNDTLNELSLHSGKVVTVELADMPSVVRNKATNATNSNYINNGMQSFSGSPSFTQLKQAGSSVDGQSSSFSGQPSRSYGNTNVSGHSSSSSYFSNGYNDGYRAAYTPGVCGLNNLGNTCFMNSAIQCMSNVPQLTQYMLSGEWERELNVDNPLGMRGEIATTYAQLIQSMWSGKFSCTVPRSFKVAVGRFKPEFSGYQQQDSQELMAFLLDGLHEDLNRIKRKPYVETKEANDRPDEVVAREAWSDYILRNASVIVDTFHGLLKSTLVCPDCQKVSVKFDPFCYLSLPLPVKRDRQIDVIFVPEDPQRRMIQYKLTVPKAGNVGHICKAMQAKTGTRMDQMIVVDVYNHRFHKIFSSGEPVSSILDRDDIFVYELSDAVHDPEVLHIPVYMREYSKLSMYSYSSSAQLFGQPVVITVPKSGSTYDSLYNAILNKLVKYIRIGDLTEAWWKKLESPTNGGSCNGDDGTEQMQEDCNEDLNGTENNEENNSSDEKRIKKEETAEKKVPQKRRLFTIHNVNSYGSAEVDVLKDNGEPVTFLNHPYLAINWKTKAKELFYDEKGDEETDVDESMSVKSNAKKQEVLLTDCLDLFTTTERLGEQDLWFCPACKEHKQASKKFDLWSLPQVLVIHLKRFSYNRYSRDKLDTFVNFPIRYSRDKLDTFVNFPISDLDLKRWVINKKHGPAVYDLIAVSNHYGGLGGGHYTAYGLNSANKKWYHFDDSSVTPMSPNESIVTKAGYVLVYVRRGTESSVDPAYPLSIKDVGRQTAAAASSASNVTNGNNFCVDDYLDGNCDQGNYENDDDMDIN